MCSLLLRLDYFDTTALATATGVNLGAPLATNDNCGLLTVTNNAPARYLKGVTTVTATSTDSSGNTATTTFTVTVTDDEAPVITAPNVGIWTEDGFVVENVGVPADIEVEQTPQEVMAGHDPQLEKAIELVLEKLRQSPTRIPERPAPPGKR